MTEPDIAAPAGEPNRRAGDAVERHDIAVIRDRLAARHPDLPPAVVTAAVTHAHDQLADRPVRGLVPLLVERAAERILTTTRPQS